VNPVVRQKSDNNTFIMKLKHTKVATLAATIITLLPLSDASASVIFFGDVNASAGVAGSASNQQPILTSFLGIGTTVLVNKQNVAFGPGANVNTWFNGLAGVTSTLTTTDITAGALVGIDLLYLDLAHTSTDINVYSSSERAVLADFIAAGNQVIIQAEPHTDSTQRINLNTFFSDLGTPWAIETSGNRNSGTVSIQNTAYSSSSNGGWSGGSYNSIVTGGTAIALGTDGGTYMSLYVVPEPSSVILLGIGA